MKKYAANWAGTTLIIGIGLATWILGTYLKVREGSLPKEAFPGVDLVAAAFVIAVIFFAMIFSYATIDGKTLRFVWLFFSRRTINIDSIIEINDQPTFKIAKSQFRSLYLFYEDKGGDRKWVEFRITIFPEKTLGELIKELKSINRKIKLDSYSEKLLQAAK